MLSLTKMGKKVSVLGLIRADADVSAEAASAAAILLAGRSSVANAGTQSGDR